MSGNTEKIVHCATCGSIRIAAPVLRPVNFIEGVPTIRQEMLTRDAVTDALSDDKYFFAWCEDCACIVKEVLLTEDLASNGLGSTLN